MAGRVAPVCWRARYMATWRGHATRPLRPLESSSSREIEKASQVSCCTSSIVGVAGAARLFGYRPARTSLVSSTSIGRRVSEWNATTRISAPSSARALVVMRRAIACNAPSSASSTPSCWTRLRRIVSRVCRSGGLISATRPD